METCIFCKLIKHEVPSKVIAENEHLLVFENIEPKAPIHWLIIPKVHYKDARVLPDEVWIAVRSMADFLMKEHTHSGVRLVTNMGDAAAVGHMHMHYLAGISSQTHV
jgi:histidine triad (HIT) family protein